MQRCSIDLGSRDVTEGLFYPEEGSIRKEDATPALIRHISEQGLEHYAKWLLQLEQDDAECIRYPRFKISDDKSGIYIRL
ncbi:hypothetical protein GCM10010912_15340 [Paenibacillus albidus]|uniref:Uncharacterized protein n=1 Tax=Paenibacillus albidus TaxID=2041023 RepID=A0A917C6A1_9BACL|nr:hypothetical protein [Paenibacillus albidus]GGF71118.1 hypothetical protein GCM10010912_15340 [Paenibacillus albidus]